MTDYIIGVDLGGTNIKAGLVDREGRIHRRFSTKTNFSADPQTISKQIFGLIEEVVESLRQRKAGAGSLPAVAKILGVGLGSPGLIDKKGETILVSPNLPQWRDIPIKRMVTERFKVPCVLENDANAAAWGEKWAGVGKDANSLVMLTLGTGIGGGIVINNTLWRGVNNVAAEIGHMVIQINGAKCGCGNNGCIEAYSSATSMVRRFKEALKNGENSLLQGVGEITAKMINDAALKGDQASLDIIRETGRYLGVALVNIMHVLNPEIIVLSGGMIGSGDLLMNPIKETVKLKAFEASRKDTQILFSLLGNDAGIIGAAGCLLNTLETSA